MMMTNGTTIRKRRVQLVFILPVITFLVTGVLAYQAIDAASSHRQVAENTLQEYTNIAAWELARLIEQDVNTAVFETFHHINVKLRSNDDSNELLPDPVKINREYFEDDCPQECPTLLPVIQFFKLNTNTGEVATRTIEDNTGFESRVIDALASDYRDTFGDNQRFAFLPGMDNDNQTVVVYSPVFARYFDNEPVLFGFEVAVENFTKLFDKIWNENPLLPQSLTGDRSNDSLMSVSIYYTAEKPVFVGGSVENGSEVTNTFEAIHDEFSGELSLRSESASLLVIGGLPGNRLPLLAGLFLLSCAFLFVAIRQVRKESELSHLRSNFVSGVSHELRTPVAQIRMFIEMLQHNRIRNDEERHRAIEIIDQEAKRLTYLVENILQFSRRDKNVVRIHPERIELHSFINDILDSFKPLASAKNIKLRHHIPYTEITTDNVALRQVLLNLIDNAVKYSPEKSEVTINAAITDSNVNILVDDEGPGIPEDERRHIWKPYTRLTRDINGTAGGSGIGLAVVYEFVELLGGKVEVTEAPSGGARFIIKLPHTLSNGKGSNNSLHEVH